MFRTLLNNEILWQGDKRSPKDKFHRLVSYSSKLRLKMQKDSLRNKWKFRILYLKTVFCLHLKASWGVIYCDPQPVVINIFHIKRKLHSQMVHPADMEIFTSTQMYSFMCVLMFTEYLIQTHDRKIPRMKYSLSYLRLLWFCVVYAVVPGNQFLNDDRKKNLSLQEGIIKP